MREYKSLNTKVDRISKIIKDARGIIITLTFGGILEKLDEPDVISIKLF